MAIVKPAEDLAARFERLYLGVISDALDSAGFREHFLGSEIRPLDASMRVAGPVLTVRGEPSRPELYTQDAQKLMRMFEEVPAGVILVYETNDQSGTAAHFGELSANAIQKRGARGIVLDGAVRDSALLSDIGFPTFCRYVSPLDGYGRWHVTSHKVTIRINHVELRPGDWVVADRDGVVAVPAELLETVIKLAEEAMVDEAEIRRAVREGVGAGDLFRQYGRF